MKEYAIKVHPSIFTELRDELLRLQHNITTEPEKNTIILSSEEPADYFNFGRLYEQVKHKHELRNSR